MTEPHNPYAPPRAEVGSGVVAAPIPRPRSVTIALVLLAVYVVLGILRLVALVRPMNEAMISALYFLGQVAVVAIHVWVWIAIARGRNWARIVLLVFTLLAIARLAIQLWGWQSLPGGVHMVLDPYALAVGLIPVLLIIVACILLFVPGRRWFENRD